MSASTVLSRPAPPLPDATMLGLLVRNVTRGAAPLDAGELDVLRAARAEIGAERWEQWLEIARADSRRRRQLGQAAAAAPAATPWPARGSGMRAGGLATEATRASPAPEPARSARNGRDGDEPAAAPRSARRPRGGWAAEDEDLAPATVRSTRRPQPNGTARGWSADERAPSRGRELGHTASSARRAAAPRTPAPAPPQPWDDDGAAHRELVAAQRTALKSARESRSALEDLRRVLDRAGQESEIPNFKGSHLGRFPLVSADFWTNDHLSERSRSVDAFSGTRARGTLTLKLR